ncbi:SUMF1/EgtB/PvdO family nonheme iron enzyme [Calothrix sp. CCY 0018]|uniref:SUMF1/EgtB/PvdO family nonheme iron enzyme n=1 Tax=Calothrix sp. CCY 0018 TaxID=3103864 RepID=UPI0039C698E1
MYGNGDINQQTDKRKQKLRKAIISAYPNITQLRMMVDDELGHNLDVIVGGSNLEEIVYNLICTAEAQGWLKGLVCAAISKTPGNEYLKAIAEEFSSNTSENLPFSPPNPPHRNPTIQTQPFEFETASLIVKSGIFRSNCEINPSRGRAESFKEDLGNGVFLEMVKIPGGSFLMGSPKDELERFDREGPQHIVTIPLFFMGKFPVTQLQYQTIMGENPSHFKGINKPVECVSWDNAVEFCARISQRTGKTYRLPSEAEWEYACRVGTTTPFYFGETITTDLANYDGNYTYGSASKGEFRRQTTDVDSFPANAFGLYDMHGNVLEWCQDFWHENYNGAPFNGDSCIKAENDNCYRLLRGSSWNCSPRCCRSAYRYRYGHGDSVNVIGFRVVVASSRTS